MVRVDWEDSGPSYLEEDGTSLQEPMARSGEFIAVQRERCPLPLKGLQQGRNAADRRILEVDLPTARKCGGPELCGFPSGHNALRPLSPGRGGPRCRAPSRLPPGQATACPTHPMMVRTNSRRDISLRMESPRDTPCRSPRRDAPWTETGDRRIRPARSVAPCRSCGCSAVVRYDLETGITEASQRKPARPMESGFSDRPGIGNACAGSLGFIQHHPIRERCSAPSPAVDSRPCPCNQAPLQSLGAHAKKSRKRSRRIILIRPRSSSTSPPAETIPSRLLEAIPLVQHHPLGIDLVARSRQIFALAFRSSGWIERAVQAT